MSNPISSAWNDVTSVADDVGSGLSGLTVDAVHAGSSVVHLAGTIIHDGVQLTEDTINAAISAVNGTLGELQNLLSLLGDSGSLRKAAAAIDGLANDLGTAGSQIFSSWEAVSGGDIWVGAGASGYENLTWKISDHLSTGSTTFHQSADSLNQWADAIDHAHQEITAAINRLTSSSVLDIAAHPGRVTDILTTAHGAADALHPIAARIGANLHDQAMRAPDVGNVSLHRPSALDHIESAVSNNWRNFARDPLGYAVDFNTAFAGGLWDGAKGLALGLWHLGKGSFESQWGTLLGIKSWQKDGEKTFMSMANGLWHLSTPYWIYRLATDPNGAASEGSKLLNRFAHWDQIEAGHANKVIGHIDGEIGLQVLAAVATDGALSALSTGGRGAAGAADLADGAAGADTLLPKAGELVTRSDLGLPRWSTVDTLGRAPEQPVTVIVGDSGADASLKSATFSVQPRAGFTDVALHGTPDGFGVTVGGSWYDITPKQLAAALQRGGYDSGPVRLISCLTGSTERGAAQQLADALGAPVLAPTKVVGPDAAGSLVVGTPQDPGEWLMFTPHASAPISLGGTLSVSAMAGLAHANSQGH